MLVPKRFEKPSKDGSQNQTMELETELENRVHPLFGFKEPYSNRFWNPNNLLGYFRLTAPLGHKCHLWNYWSQFMNSIYLMNNRQREAQRGNQRDFALGRVRFSIV